MKKAVKAFLSKKNQEVEPPVTKVPVVRQPRFPKVVEPPKAAPKVVEPPKKAVVKPVETPAVTPDPAPEKKGRGKGKGKK